MYIHIYTHRYVCIYTHTYIYITHTYTHAHTHIVYTKFIYQFIHIHTCIYIYIFIYITDITVCISLISLNITDLKKFLNNLYKFDIYTKVCCQANLKNCSFAITRIAKKKVTRAASKTFFFTLFKVNVTFYFKCYLQYVCSVNLN